MSVGSDLAQRTQVMYSLPYPADEASLLGVFRQLDIPYLFIPDLGEPGLFLSGPHPFALFETGAPPYVVAHECYHAISSASDQEAVLYQFRAREREAEAFARELCG
jgi:hypothetical protein